ncbi:MAG: hypothetical protein M3Z14_02695, partial [Candidatus Eremiobacteraeota bacterium]|nr:hypothetical protein [Candidatus Eremiobacteraeota bacterium]
MMDARLPGRLWVNVLSLLLLFTMASGQLSADDKPSSLATLRATRERFLSHFSEIKAHAGDLTYALPGRLADDIDSATIVDPPAGYTREDWRERLEEVTQLDQALIEGLISGKDLPITDKPGLSEHFIHSKVDGTLQPFALYIPRSYRPEPAQTLVVLLHGNGQTESELLGAPYFRKLADDTGTVILAPFGRGLYDFAAPADEEIYQTLDQVQMVFHAGPRHVFLVGYSMGGFSVFKVGPLHPNRWGAV